MSEKKRIAILGGGYGGVLTAKKLAKKFKKDEEVEITLIDQNPYHTLLTELHEVAAGRVSEDAIRIDFKKIFAKRKVKVVLDEITDLDFKNNVLKSENNTYEYDYLVIGAGCKPTYFGVKGAEEFCHKLWSFEDAVALKEHILKMFRKAVKEKNKEERKKLLTFIVVGGGFTGVEMMGELGEWKERLCKDFYIEQEEVTLILVDDLPKILPNFPDKLIAKTKKRLNKLGVTVLTNAGVTEVTGDTATIRNNGIVNTYTVIWTAGVEGSDIIGKMDIQQKGRKRIVTDDKLRSLDYKNVYVVGDNIFFIPEGEERPLPQMVENAEESAALIAHNVYTDIKGGEKKSYKPSFHGAMVCVGGKYGVANVGAGKNFFALSGFFALFVKHFINIVYFIQVAGFNKCWSYLLHEFFHVKDNRSFVGGYFSKSSPNFWLLVLRMFVGYKWLTEGLEKLPKIIADPSKIFLIPAPVVDGATAATAAAPAAGAAPVATWVALPVPGFIEKIVKWSMDTFFYTGDGGYTVLATIFQTGMVIAEILVGIMLIVGLFSALASLMSVAMGIMIWTSGMAPTEMLWYLSAGIALIGGSGSTFGMDYYVLPILKKYWKSIGWVKKSYLYVD
ncbi:FAD-dependent oxidoreductase [Clostridium tagluense]|uniref:FAD-dependent oxidoreductase n=1 Tax=Clostridium tagluense TaxID=360422 RepID=UPI001C0C858C|nr:FAD-dependent oxidoreductase [Clostridium tagluense]MBU3126214.1 FAD-dependent oxidoreductase [Clostridium tagluense]MCB2309594.1 FAD-dependent oxidoreductase [Clostridium tagluense]MCB2314876.1 FAD-dependent oxidoreductase [Clostridium tagluense]MCB2319725.1 FAD-dependent oxidoreductase [Clostridium tagluense]MCB2324188.1 FAD-dependent oxidoreductase [Clostridium tagluense]